MNASILLLGLVCGQADGGFKARIENITPIQIENEDRGKGRRAVVQAANVTKVQPKQKRAAKELLDSLLEIPSKSKITGDERTLLELVRKKRNLADQQQVVIAYWNVSKSIASYRWQAQSYEFLSQLKSPANRSAQAALAAQVASAKADTGRARLAVLKAQAALAELVDSGDNFSIPTDRPLVGRYLTRFDELYGRRTAPRHLKNIDRLLPFLHQSVQDYGHAIQTTKQAADLKLVAYKAQKATLTEVLQYHQRLNQNQQRFLDAVYSYNSNIARYALAVAPKSISSEAVVGMLIPLRRSSSPARANNRVQHASNEQPVRQTRRSKGWQRRE